MIDPKTLVNDQYGKYIGVRESKVKPGVAEYFNAQTQEGFSTAQQLADFAYAILGDKNINAGNVFDAIKPSVVSSSSALRQEEAKAKLDQQRADLDKEKELKRLTTEKAIADIKKNLEGGEVPDRPDLESDYGSLNKKYGIDSMLKELDQLNNAIATSKESTTAGLNIEKQRVQPRGLQQGKMEAIADAGLAEYNAMTDRKNALTEMIKAKGDIINNIMSLKQQDYSNALNEYNTKFNRAIAIQEQISNYEDRQLAQENQARDDARANLTVLQNLVQESGKGWDEVDIQTKMNIQAEEARAGIPVGTFAAFARALPQAKLLTTSTGYDGGGNEIVSFIYADENGNPGVVRTIKTGAVVQKSSSGGGSNQLSEYELRLMERGDTYEALESAKGKDGYVSPQSWQKLRRDYAFDKADFDANFRDYINPANPQDYAGFERYETGFKPKDD